MAIYELDGTFTISSKQQWRPGVYDSQRTARYAQRFTDDELQRLQDSVNPGGVITFAMLQNYRRAHVTAPGFSERHPDR